MPPTINPPNRWLATQFENIWSAIRGLSQNQTTYVIDPTILNPSATNPNCKAIIGNIATDNFGNATGLIGWGIASKKTGSWLQL